jgi:uncharacterized protein YcaQ
LSASLAPLVELEPAAARRLAVARQGYASRSRRATTAEVEATIDRLGAVQLDSVTAVDRAHRLTLASRVGRLPDGALNRLRRSGRVFEYWAHEACLLPIRDYPFFRRMMVDREHHPWFDGVLDTHGELARQILRDVEQHGPRSARAYGGAGTGYWQWTPAKKVFETLWTLGYLAVRERRGFERIYDLTERVIPAEQLGEPPDEEACLRHFVLRAVEARGVVTRARLADYYRVRGGQRRLAGALADVVADGGAIPARVAAHDVLLAPDWERDVGAEPRAPVLLCPFDNLIWDREETRRLFGFSHTLEIYRRPHERVYGYYVLPLLAGDRLIGRVDLKRDRPAGVLRAQAVHWEGRPAWGALRRALDRLAAALGVRAELADAAR